MYLELVLLPVYDDDGDLLVHVDEDGAQHGGDQRGEDGPGRVVGHRVDDPSHSALGRGRGDGGGHAESGSVHTQDGVESGHAQEGDHHREVGHHGAHAGGEVAKCIVQYLCTLKIPR